MWGVSEDMESSGIPQSPSSHTRASSHRPPPPGTHPVPAASLLAPLTTSHEGCGRNPRHFQVPTCCPPGAPRLLSHGGGGTSPETLWRHVPRLQVPERGEVGTTCLTCLGKSALCPHPKQPEPSQQPLGSGTLVSKRSSARSPHQMSGDGTSQPCPHLGNVCEQGGTLRLAPPPGPHCTLCPWVLFLRDPEYLRKLSMSFA